MKIKLLILYRLKTANLLINCYNLNYNVIFYLAIREMTYCYEQILTKHVTADFVT